MRGAGAKPVLSTKTGQLQQLHFGEGLGEGLEKAKSTDLDTPPYWQELHNSKLMCYSHLTPNAQRHSVDNLSRFLKEKHHETFY